MENKIESANAVESANAAQRAVTAARRRVPNRPGRCLLAVLIATAVFGLASCSSTSSAEQIDVLAGQDPPRTTTVAPSEQTPWERSPWEYDSAAVDFDWMGTPTFEANLANLGTDRIREIEFFLPPGDGDIAFGIRNPDPIRITGQGIAVRTDTFAQILRSSETFEMPRPAECIDGQCRLFMWLTMGPQFLNTHPSAELLIWAGDGAAVTIEPVPMENLSDETFRRWPQAGEYSIGEVRPIE